MKKRNSLIPSFRRDTEEVDHWITGDLPRLIEMNNTDRQTIACVLVDNSYSTSRRGIINEINDGLIGFINALQDDRIASRRVQIGAFTFGGGLRPITEGFVSPENFRPPKLKPGGVTPLAESLTEICHNIKVLKAYCTEMGIDTGPVQCLVLTDGSPTDDESVMSEAARMMLDAEQSGLAQFHCFVVDGCDSTDVDRLFPRWSAGLSVAEIMPMFRAFSTSLRTVSRRVVGSKYDMQDDIRRNMKGGRDA